MANKCIQGKESLAKKFKFRRNELHLTIEEAALRAGVGSKTWSRYEAGGSIRLDKCKGICKALNWNKFPDDEASNDSKDSFKDLKKHDAWSKFLEINYGAKAAIAFAVGSDIISNQIKEDLQELSLRPKGTHIGELSMSWLKESLPEQFLTKYNYEFLYLLKCTLNKMKLRAKNGVSMVAHSVIEELLFYLCNEEAVVWFEMNESINESLGNEDFDIQNWIFELFDDVDILTNLYNNVYLDSEHSYHFSHWEDYQFYVDR